MEQPKDYSEQPEGVNPLACNDLLSADLVRDLVRQQEEMGWPDDVPAFAEMPDGRFKRHQDLTVGDCEQITEWRTRIARMWIKRFEEGHDKRSMVNAARNVLLARLYRCQFFTLMGMTETTEDDMPFPCR